MGYCGSISATGERHHVDFSMPHAGEITADEFAVLVMIADDFDAACIDYDLSDHRKHIRKLFFDVVGTHSANAAELFADYSQE